MTISDTGAGLALHFEMNGRKWVEDLDTGEEYVRPDTGRTMGWHPTKTDEYIVEDFEAECFYRLKTRNPEEFAFRSYMRRKYK